jgi:RNA polymerase sigma-70 factor (ECF subfamily)
MGIMTSIEECGLALSSMESTGSEIDLTALVETYSALLFRVAYSVLRSRTEAEDVVQDVFVRVLEHRMTLLAVRDMRVWLVRVAWNLAIDRRRRIRPEQMDVAFAGSLVARGLPADEAVDEARRMAAVLREMERLPKGERHVLLLSAVEELETVEMAKVLGRSESAVRALLFRARTRLRERLEKGGKA